MFGLVDLLIVIARHKRTEYRRINANGNELSSGELKGNAWNENTSIFEDFP
jgi:hypothetical protein